LIEYILKYLNAAGWISSHCLETTFLNTSQVFSTSFN